MYPSTFSNQLIAIRVVVVVVVMMTVTVVTFGLLGCYAERRSQLSRGGVLKFHIAVHQLTTSCLWTSVCNITITQAGC